MAVFALRLKIIWLESGEFIMTRGTNSAALA